VLRHAFWVPSSATVGVKRLPPPPTDRLPIRAAEECAICRLLSFVSSPASAVVFVPMWALVQDLPVQACPTPQRAAIRPFQARGPPLDAA